MTTPHGYPDYQAYPIWRGNLIGSGFIVVNSVTPFVRSLYVAQFAAIGVNIQMQSAGGVNITLQWFTDSTMTVSQGFYSFVCFGLNTTVSVILPNIGNFLQVQIATPSVPNQSVAVSMQPVNIPVQKPVYQLVGNSLSGQIVTLAASASAVGILPFVVEGNGLIMVECDTAAAPFTVELQGLAADGTVAFELYKSSGAAAILNTPFQATSNPVQFKVTNNDVVNRNFNYHFSVVPA